MTSKEKALKIFETYYTEWENREQRNESGYAYEQTYVEMMHKLQQAILQSSVGDVSENKNIKKKSKPVWGK